MMRVAEDVGGDRVRESVGRAVIESLAVRFCDGVPHRMRELRAEFGPSAAVATYRLAEAGTVRKVAPGWYVAAENAGRVSLPAYRCGHGKVGQALAEALVEPRSIAELARILGKSRQAVWAQLRRLERVGAVQGPPVVVKHRVGRGVWRLSVPTPVTANRRRAVG